MMGQPQQPIHLLWLVSLVAIWTKNNHATAAVRDAHVRNLTNVFLKAIPPGDSNSSVTSLVVERNQITLSDEDKITLAGYPQLVELHLDLNRVTYIPARYLSVVPNLSVLSLSNNLISSLVPESFYGLDALRVLNLSHNLLTSLPAQLFRPLNNLQVVDLQGNPWNCSCLLLSSIQEIRAAGVTVAGTNTTCASPEQQPGADLFEALTNCYPKSADTPNPPCGTVGHSQQPKVPTNLPKVMVTTSPDHNAQNPAPGNTWRFAACIAALVLATSILIVCAVKGPSWYRLFHNYRHRRLQQDDNREGHAASSVYSETDGEHMSQKTFTFAHPEGEEDLHYFEDPYVKAEE